MGAISRSVPPNSVLRQSSLRQLAAVPLHILLKASSDIDTMGEVVNVLVAVAVIVLVVRWASSGKSQSSIQAVAILTGRRAHLHLFLGLYPVFGVYPGCRKQGSLWCAISILRSRLPSKTCYKRDGEFNRWRLCA